MIQPIKLLNIHIFADKELVVQGRAALLPSLTLSGSTNWNEYYQDKQLTTRI